MRVLIADRDACHREQLIEVMTWFGRVASILQAERIEDLDHWPDHRAVDIALVGELEGKDGGESVSAIRRAFPSASIAAFGEIDPENDERVRAAGAALVFDIRSSAWKTALVLRSLVWPETASATGERSAQRVLAL